MLHLVQILHHLSLLFTQLKFELCKDAQEVLRFYYVSLVFGRIIADQLYELSPIVGIVGSDTRVYVIVELQNFLLVLL